MYRGNIYSDRDRNNPLKWESPLNPAEELGSIHF